MQASVRIFKLSNWEIQILFSIASIVQVHQVHAVRHTRGISFSDANVKALHGSLW